MRRLDVSVPCACALAGLSGLHALWAAGSSWPAADARALSAVVAGTDAVPSPSACLTVACALAVAAALVAGAGGPHPLARLGRAGVAAVLLGRGLAGVTGLTGWLVPWSPSQRFRRVDRRAYGPLCLALGAAAAASAR